EVVRGGQASHPLKGLEDAGLLGEVGRQPRHDLRRPGIFHEGKGLALDNTAGIMALDQHGVLLKMGVIVSQHHLTGRLCWSWLSWFICLSTRKWAMPTRLASFRLLAMVSPHWMLVVNS